MKLRLLAVLALFCQLSVYAEGKYNQLTVTPLPSLTVSKGQGVSAPFAGVDEAMLWVAGGANFPVEGAPKKFYASTYHLGKRFWKQEEDLPTAVAYGFSATTPYGVVCVGGTDGTGSLASAYLYNKGEIRELPSLPVGLDNLGGAYGSDGWVYAAGGQTDGKGSHRAFRLKLPSGTEWEALPEMPGDFRLQPACVVQTASRGANFYVLGGFDPERRSVCREGLCYDPKTHVWTETTSLPKGCLVGASAVASGCNHILCFGGVCDSIFEKALGGGYGEDYLTHPVAWYRFRHDVWAYNTITDTWIEMAGSPALAKAGAAVVPYDGGYAVINGESKPGMRSTQVVQVKLVSEPSFGWVNWLVLVLYLVGMLLLGYYFMKRESGAEDFFKGGGRIPWWAAGISIYATMLSAITYMAYPAKAFATDWTYYPMLITILVVSFPVIHYYLPFFRRLDVTTAYEYLERRFNAATRLMASALFIVFMVARMALVLYLPSLALTAVTGIDIYTCIILMGLVTIVYCTMGGVEAVVWGDVVQGIILVGGALLAIGYLVFSTEGGPSAFLDIAFADDKFRLFDWSLDYRSATFWVIILGGMANNLISYTSDQTVIQRYLTTKDEGAARRSILMNGVMSVFISVAFFAIGTGLYTFYKTHPAAMDVTMAKGDIIFPFFMMTQLPAGLAGLLIAAIFAATMSTISSNINSVATAFSVDFYKRWNGHCSEHHLLKVARMTCIVSGIIGVCIALMMATWQILSLLDFFQEILGLLSSGLGGLFFIGIFMPRVGGRAALTGFVSGVVAVLLVKNLTEASFLLYGLIGMGVSIFVALVMSYLLPQEKDIQGLSWRTLK